MRLVIRKIQFAPLNQALAPGPRLCARFLLSAQPLQLQAWMDKEVCDPISRLLVQTPFETLSLLITYFWEDRGGGQVGKSAEETNSRSLSECSPSNLITASPPALGKLSWQTHLCQCFHQQLYQQGHQKIKISGQLLFPVSCPGPKSRTLPPLTQSAFI